MLFKSSPWMGRTPIFAAGGSKHGGEVFEALSKAGADLKIKDNEGRRPYRHRYPDYQRRLGSRRIR
jgi:hypothetical protein